MAGGLDTNIEDDDRYQLPKEGDEEAGGAPDLPGILRRIREVARVLDSFKALRDSKRSRTEYLDQVSHTGWPPSTKGFLLPISAPLFTLSLL